MQSIFDTQAGRIILRPNCILAYHSTREEIEAQGFVFFRDYPRLPEPKRISYAPIKCDEHQIYFTLYFERDCLLKLAFAFIEGQAEPVERHHEHCQFLEQQLGAPSGTSHAGLTVRYEYSWGEILAAYDPRNNSSLIHMGWQTAKKGLL